jgi:hypothetical protein
VVSKVGEVKAHKMKKGGELPLRRLPLPLTIPLSPLISSLSAVMENLGFNAFLYPARVPSVTSPLRSCGMGHQTAKQIIIHCLNCLAARLALRDDQSRLPDYNQLVTTSTGLKKVTRWVIEKGDAWPVPEGQGFPLPTWASFPSQQLSWTTILVQQETATNKGNRLTSTKRKVFIALRVFLLYM